MDIKPITNPAEHRAALAEIDSLMGAEKGTPEGGRLNALANLVVAYEAMTLKNGMRPVHPGEILAEDYIKPLGVSVHAVALAMNVPYSLLSEIIKGERDVSADTALLLERYFGSVAQGWLNLQGAYDLRIADTLTGKSEARVKCRASETGKDSKL